MADLLELALTSVHGGRTTSVQQHLPYPLHVEDVLGGADHIFIAEHPGFSREGVLIVRHRVADSTNMPNAVKITAQLMGLEQFAHPRDKCWELGGEVCVLIRRTDELQELLPDEVAEGMFGSETFVDVRDGVALIDPDLVEVRHEIVLGA